MRLTHSPHLQALLTQADDAAALLGRADPTRLAHAVAAARSASARLSARLDGSPLSDATADEVELREQAGAPLASRGPTVSAAGAQAAGWAQVLRLEGLATQEVAAVEYANLLAGFDAEARVAPLLLARPAEALATLHARMGAGLVDPRIAGRPRRTEQAVHDGAQGRMIYRCPDPDRLPGLLAGLYEWLTGPGRRVHPLVAAGVVHERLLAWHPFEACNGRLARSAARCILRARGLDPAGVAVPERAFAADPLGYYAEVAATMRRGDDLGPWLERHAEAVVAGLEQAANMVAPDARPAPPAHAVAVVMGLAPGEALTVSEYATAATTDRETAQRDLLALSRAGLIALEPRTRGLRYRRTPTP